MRNRFSSLAPVFANVGTLLMVFAALILMPIFVLIFTTGGMIEEVSPLVYLVPAAVAFAAGSILHMIFKSGALEPAQSMLVCALGWLGASAVGALPYRLAELPQAVAEVRSAIVGGDGSSISYLDAYFEAMAGFTTTGITMLAGLEHFPPSLLFWRSLTQWLGGLGILSFFILVLFSARSAHALYGAESHKVFTRRPRPGIFNTVKILWTIYTCITVAIVVGLLLCGVRVLDSLNLAFTTVSTGGFTPFDESVRYFAARPADFPHYRAIEYLLIAGMFAGAISFITHYRLIRGSVKALWDTGEIRLFWTLAVVGTALVFTDVVMNAVGEGAGDIEEQFRTSLFQTAALLTNTGFATRSISAPGYFFAVSRQVFLLFMFTGACAGSTSGGLKIYRVHLMARTLYNEIWRAVRPHRAVHMLLVDDSRVDMTELQRCTAVFFGWLALIVAGGVVTAMLSPWGAMESLSGMTSAVSNVGPCFIPPAGLMQLPETVKFTYILGMLAGRLEILPVLLLFNRKAWT